MSGLVAEVQGLVTANDNLTATLQQLEQQLTSKTHAHSESVRKNQALEDKLEIERVKGLKAKEKLELEIKGLKGKLKDKEEKVKVLEKEIKGVKSKAESDARNKVEGELALLRAAHEEQQRRLIEQFKDTLKRLAVGWTRSLEKDVEVAEKRFETMMGSSGSMEVDEKEQDGQRFDREEIDPDLMQDHHRHAEPTQTSIRSQTRSQNGAETRSQTETLPDRLPIGPATSISTSTFNRTWTQSLSQPILPALSTFATAEGPRTSVRSSRSRTPLTPLDRGVESSRMAEFGEGDRNNGKPGVLESTGVGMMVESVETQEKADENEQEQAPQREDREADQATERDGELGPPRQDPVPSASGNMVQTGKPGNVQLTIIEEDEDVKPTLPIPLACGSWTLEVEVPVASSSRSRSTQIIDARTRASTSANAGTGFDLTSGGGNDSSPTAGSRSGRCVSRSLKRKSAGKHAVTEAEVDEEVVGGDRGTIMIGCSASSPARQEASGKGKKRRVEGLEPNAREKSARIRQSASSIVAKSSPATTAPMATTRSGRRNTHAPVGHPPCSPRPSRSGSHPAEEERPTPFISYRPSAWLRSHVAGNTGQMREFGSRGNAGQSHSVYGGDADQIGEGDVKPDEPSDMVHTQQLSISRGDASDTTTATISMDTPMTTMPSDPISTTTVAEQMTPTPQPKSISKRSKQTPLSSTSAKKRAKSRIPTVLGPVSIPLCLDDEDDDPLSL